MPGMLHVAVLRSPYAHARIRRIEKSKAEALNGVAVVLTGAEVAQMPGVDPYFGPAFRDQPIVVVDKVCFVVDPVIAVAAKDRRTAEDALQLVEVDYEPLPAVLDLLEAVRPKSPLVHEQHRPAKAFADLAHVKAGQKSNICYQFKLRRGDVDKAFAAADRVFEDTFSSPPAQHLPMEPHVTLVYLDENQRINVWTASQTPSYVRTELSNTFGIPMNRIRVRIPYLGGGYGAKLYAKLEPLVTALALITKKPVRYALTREEEFLTITKHKVITKIKTAVKNGVITARKCEVFWDTGAYAEIGPRVVHKSGYTSAGPYRIPNVWIDSYCVYTNHVPAGAFRGFGVPQVTWAYDLQGQIVAEELGVSFDQVHVVQPDTDITPYDTITAGSRSTYHMGNAVRTAAGKIKAELFQVVAKKLEVNPDDLVAQRGRIFVRGTEERGMTISEAFLAKFGSLGTTLTGEAICQPEAIPTDPETGQSEKCTEYWFPSATTAEVEVDTDTGQVKILQFYSVGDTGTAINPKHCEQQLLGSAITHLGLTLFEEMIFDEGQLVNGSLLDYQVASIKDLPDSFRSIVVEVPHETGPFGAKGVGETGALTVSAAIANAIQDAIGVRIHELPITPEKVLRALTQKKEKSSPGKVQ